MSQGDDKSPNADDDEKTQIAASASDEDKTQIATPPPVTTEDDRTQIAVTPAEDDDFAQVATPEPLEDDRTQIVSSPIGSDKTELVTAPILPADGTDDPASPPPAEASVPPAAPMPMPSAAPEPPKASGDGSPVPIGTLINNNYEIKKLINAGGMGEVFWGENVFTGDSVAIKIVLQSLAHDEKVAALFMREAKVLCQLSDQAIVRYYNFVKDADLDRFCLIMEFIEGYALSDHIQKVAPLTTPQAVGLMRRVAAGLDRAHKMDVIHRDLSPDNVMLRDGAVENAVLIDFGIAKSAEMAESTLHGQLAGKFKYISPEQLGHFGGEIGPRTDIYGLGLMMAAALRGAPLDMGSSVVEAVNARREIPDLSEIDPVLRPLLAHMLEPDPAHRPARMLDVIDLLENPSKVPAKYGSTQPSAGAWQPQASTTPPGSGISQPPGAPLGGVTQPGLLTTSPGSASPFPETTGIQPPQPLTDLPAAAQDEPKGGLLRWVFVMFLLLGIGGFVAWKQGFLPGGSAGDPGVAAGNPEAMGEDPGNLDPSTREGMLAAWADDPCSFATRLRAGPNTGMIATYAQDMTVFEGLLDAYDTAFGARPSIIEHLVSAEHCPVLSLANELRAPGAAPPIITLDTNVMESNGSIVGRLSDRQGRPVWLALVTTAGGVYNLSDRLTEQADGSATFTFSLVAEENDGPSAQMLIAVVADRPLIAALAAADGTRASSLMPLIEAEIAGRDDARSGAGIAGFELRP